MNLHLMKTLKSIERYLDKEEINIEELKKAYEQTLRLRSQLISVIYDMEQYVEPKKENPKPDIPAVVSDNQSVVQLVIHEPLPARKELTAAVEEHWIDMIHKAIAEKSRTGIPKYDKAFVMIKITSPRGSHNSQVWDTSNRAINVIINNLKGIFFKDDDFEHMGCWIVADWGKVGETIIKICDFNLFFNPNSNTIFNEMMEEL